MGTPTYLLVDGENIDATLGTSVLGRRPDPDERPRWDRVLHYCNSIWDQDTLTRGLFFLNASSGHMPMGFVQALLAMDYRPVPLSASAEEKVVDIGIQRTLDAIAERLLQAGVQVGVFCFREFLNTQLAALELEGLELFDLELDVRAFTSPLPRVRIIPLEEFDPQQFI